MAKVIVVILLIFSFYGCGTKNSNITNSNSVNYPEWLHNPSSDKYIGGVGICGTHIRGKTGQRELAISRAIEEIARQKKVEVSNVLSVSSKGSSDSMSSNMSYYSVHTIDGSVINAVIVDMWIHPKTDELYIYMREEVK